MFPLRRCFTLFLLCAMLAAAPAWASLQDEVNDMFDSMSNVTNPGMVMDQRRGLISGGQYSLRSHVMDVQLLSVLPPSVAMGCNGIDLFGGSFSFISADQFIQLLRTIAANASGYAFKMALQAMCPSCDAAMSNLQGIIQKMNRMSVNSCQAGKKIASLATYPTPAVLNSGVQHASNAVARATGAVKDAWSSIFTSGNEGKSSIEDVAATDSGRQTLEDKQVIGNVVWMALKKANAGGWWGHGDTGFLEAVMSVTGSVIVRPPVSGSDQPPSFTTIPPILKIKDFMKGSADGKFITVYQCHSDLCYNAYETGDTVTDPTMHQVKLDNFTAQVHNMVTNIVMKYVQNEDFSTEEQAFVDAAPASVGALLRNLAQTSRGMALLYANQAAPTIAEIMAAHLVMEMVRTATIAMGQSTAPSAVQMRTRLAQVAQDARAEANRIQGGLTSLKGMIGTYKDMREVAEKRRLGINKLVMQNGIRLTP